MLPLASHPAQRLSSLATRLGRAPRLDELLRELTGPSAGTPADSAPQAAPEERPPTPSYDPELSADPRFRENDPGYVDPFELFMRLLWEQVTPRSPLWGGGFQPPQSGQDTPGEILPGGGNPPRGGGIFDGGSVRVPSTQSQSTYRSRTVGFGLPR